MSSVETATTSGPDKNAPAPVGMVTHLKHLIESLPVCVMRTDLEGCLLAANDSALQLLGVAEHAKVLSKSLSDRISAEHTEDWRSFLRRSWSEGAGSVECELIDFNGAHRVILVKSVAQPTHADGIQSLILTVQDRASLRRLERALNEHQGCAAKIDALHTELEQSAADRQRLVALLETLQTEDGRVTAHDAAGDALKEQIEELQSALAAKEQEWQNRCDGLVAQNTQHDADRQKLAGLLEERTEEQQRFSAAAASREAEHQSTKETLQERIAEIERVAVAKDQEWQKRCDDLAAEIAEHATERQNLSNACDRQDAERQRLSSLLEQRDAEQQRLSLLLEQRDAEQQRLSLLLEQRDAEHEQLSTLLEQRVDDHLAAGKAFQRTIDELERALKAAEHEWQKRTEELTAQLTEHAAARLQLTNALAERDVDQRASNERSRQRIDELERTLKANEEESQKRCDALAAQLTELSTERDRLSNLVEQHNSDRRATGDTMHERIAELERALKASEDDWQKRRAELTAELVVHLTEEERLSALLKQRDDEYQRLSAALKEHDDERQRLSETLKQRDDQHQQLTEAWKQRDGEYQRQLDLLKQHESDHERLSESLKQHESEHERLTELLKRRDEEHLAAVEGLQQQIVQFEQALTANDEAWKQRCEELASELTARDEERRQRWEEARAELVEQANERRRLSELLEHREAEQKRLVDEHAVEKIQIEQSIRGECERVQADHDESRRREIDVLRLDIRQLVEDLHGTAAQLEQRNDEYERLMEEVTTPCDRSELVDPADVERLMKSVAAYRIELVQVTENTIRTLEPMATAGRVAIASSRELQAAVEAVDARSRQLLAQCGLDDVNRSEIESLRRDSIGAASLVRQLLQVFGDSTRSAGHGAETAREEIP